MRNRTRPSSLRTWLSMVALLVATPFVAGCDGLLATVAPIWGVAYAYELFLMPSRSLLGTAMLDVINTF